MPAIYAGYLRQESAYTLEFSNGDTAITSEKNSIANVMVSSMYSDWFLRYAKVGWGGGVGVSGSPHFSLGISFLY